MKLINKTGYYLNDLEKQLGKQQFEKLAKWLRGQTVFMERVFTGGIMSDFYRVNQ